MAAARINLHNTTTKVVFVEDIGYERKLEWQPDETKSVLENDADLSYSIQKLMAAGVLEIVA